MEKKKILIVCRSFFPEISPRANRAFELVTEFALMGHEVVVYTRNSNQEHKTFADAHGIKINYYARHHMPDIVVRANKIVFLLTKTLNKLLYLIIYYPYIEDAFSIPKAISKEERFDLLISIAFPHSVHWGVAKAIRNYPKIALKWVADCGDPFMGNTLEIKRPFYFKYIEKWFCRKANFISVPVEHAVNAYYPEFRDKIVIIPQGFKFEEVNNHRLRNSVPTFLYAGLFIPQHRDPRPFLEYLLRINKDFKFLIYTKQHDLVKPYSAKSGGRISIHDYIPRGSLLQKIAEMDFTVNFDNNIEEMIPSKLIDYVIANKPILNIRSEIDTITINQFLEGNYENQLIIENKERFRIENVCQKFLELI